MGVFHMTLVHGYSVPTWRYIHPQLKTWWTLKITECFVGWSVV